MGASRASNSLPCLTLRENTERPETITIGTNELIGTDPSKLVLVPVMTGQRKTWAIPPIWDGKASVAACRAGALAPSAK